MRRVLPLLALLGALSAQTPVTIQDRNVIFQYSVYPNAANATTGTTVFRSGGSNHLPLSWWYYHVAGDATGSAFNTSNGQMTATLATDRRSATLEWANADGRNVAARLVHCLYSTGSTTGVSVQAMTITNNTGAPLTITVYAYADVDVDDISSDDSASQITGLPAGQTEITDPSRNRVFFLGRNHAAWQAALWPTLRDAILGGPHQLTNGGLPMNMQDYSGAFSWTLNLAPNASETMNCLLAINYLPRSTGVAQATPYGTAKPGTNGLPQWTLNRPFAGFPANLEVTNGVAGATPIALIGTVQSNVPLPPFGTVYVVPVTSFSMPSFNASGTSSLPLPVPVLNSGIVHFQALWADTGAAGNVAHTSGLTWSIGSF